MKCWICERACDIAEGKSGACRMYRNNGSSIVETYPNRYLIRSPISIETMPMLHYYPGGKFMQITSAGCNFNCPGCISTVIVNEMDASSQALQTLSPQRIIDLARDDNCLGIAFLMNDPLASFHSFREVARQAKEAGLLAGCSSNAYFTAESLQQLIPYLDFINIGMKGYSDESYRSCGAKTVQPVLRNLEKLYRGGIHVEVSCMAASEKEQELKELAWAIAGISTDIPLQVMRFLPMEDAAQNREMSIRDAENLVRELKRDLKYVYLFNSPGSQYLNTYCPDCGSLMYKRDFYGPMGAKLIIDDGYEVDKHTCSRCSNEIAIKGTRAAQMYQEGSFQGGYPFTRALEMIEAILLAIGIRDKKTVVKMWEDVLTNDRLGQLHQDLQKAEKYVALVREYGQKCGQQAKAEQLASYIEEKVDIIGQGYRQIGEKPRVYYCMGKLLFAIKGERFENQMVALAGGISVNKELKLEGRPGTSILPAQLEALAPEIIFISAFLSSPVEDFLRECRSQGINIKAVSDGKVFTYPSPGWDFGSPRWVLGLMYMANILHPEIYSFDLDSESRHFYRRFYDLDYEALHINRSFSKPSCLWQWQR